MTYDIIDSGYVTVEGKRYKFKVSKMNVEFKVLPICNHLDLENEEGEKIETVIFEEDTIENRIKKLLEWGKW